MFDSNIKRKEEEMSFFFSNVSTKNSPLTLQNGEIPTFDYTCMKPVHLEMVTFRKGSL